jgi:transcription elongation factor Elf1
MAEALALGAGPRDTSKGNQRDLVREGNAMSEEIDYLVCNTCETPCYVFEVDAKDKITSAYCGSCGNDEPKDFRVPDVDEMDGD